MILFTICLAILYVISLTRKSPITILSKDKSNAVKGVLAILIVFHHFSTTCDISSFSEFRRWGSIIVSVFFFMSGYGLGRSITLKGKVYLSNFLSHRLWKSVILPYAIALIIFLVYLNVDVPDASTLVGDWSRGFTLLPNAWFIVALALMYLGFYFINITSARCQVVKMFLYTLVYIIIVYSIGFERCWYVSVIMFPLGMLYAEKENELVTLFNRYKARIWLIPLMMGITGICFIMQTVVSSIVAFMALTIALVFVMTSTEVERIGKIGVFSFLSAISYEIYLCHGVAMKMCRGEYLNISDDWMFVIAVVALTLILASGVKYIVSRLAGTSRI